MSFVDADWGVVCERLDTREELKIGSQPSKRQPPKKSRNYSPLARLT
jgi:hypothetical protein